MEPSSPAKYPPNDAQSDDSGPAPDAPREAAGGPEPDASCETPSGPAPDDSCEAATEPVPDASCEPAGDPVPDASCEPAGDPEPDAAPDALQLRRESLAPQFAEFLHWFSTEVDPADVPRSVDIGGRRIELGPWERSTLQTAARPGGDEPERALGMIAEGVAVQARFADLRDRLDEGESPPPSDPSEFLDEVVAELAVGIAMLHELQWDINRMIGSGRLAEAKSLTAFRKAVTVRVSEVRERIGAAQLKAAEMRARDLVIPPSKREAEEEIPLDEAVPAVPSWATYEGMHKKTAAKVSPWLSERRRAGKRSRANRLRLLLWALTALLLVYAAVLIPRLHQEPPTPVLTLEQLAHIDSVVRIKARPPSLYVELDTATWRARNERERQGILEELGRVAGAAGYSGIQARTGDGTTVGQWMSKTGVRLTPPGRKPS
jgi:hypothetical protein